ncbi:MAG: hypothetical protein WKF92_09335 [Pyrinomonadaceae bacterium]
MTIAELAAAFGVSDTCIAHRLKKVGALSRQPVKRSRAVNHAEAARLYQQEELTVAEIAAKLLVAKGDITKSQCGNIPSF